MRRVLSVISAIVLLLFVSSIVWADDPSGSIVVAPFETNTPLTLNSVSLNPSSAYPGDSVTLSGTYSMNAGNDSVAICVYIQQDSGVSAASISSFTGGSISYTSPAGCPSYSGYDVSGYYNNDGVPPFGESFNATIDINTTTTAGNYNIGIIMYEGTGACETPGTGTCATSSNDLVVLTVNPAPSTVYVNSSGTCSGSPCYSSLSAAHDAVAAGGTIYVESSFSGPWNINKNVTVDGKGGGEVTGDVNVNSTVTMQNMTVGGTLTVGGGGDVTLRGNTLNGLTVDGTVTAYANNITGAIGGTGTLSAPHNWWGSYTTQPSGVSNADWGKRLGASVVSWGLGSLGNASLSLTSGSGTGVIVSHGRTSVPFGQGTNPYQGQVCSDYYDFFVVNGSGSSTWDVTIPIDTSPSQCQDTVLAKLQMSVFDFSNAACLSGSPDGACWNGVVTDLGGTVLANFSQSTLTWQGATEIQLGGTPIVGGTVSGTDPTAITLEVFSGSAATDAGRLPVGALVGAMLLSAAGVVALVARRRR